MKKFEDKLKSIDSEILKLQQEKYQVAVECANEFTQRAKDWLGDGKFIKFKRKDDAYTCAFIESISCAVYKNAKDAIALTNVIGHGLILFGNSPDVYYHFNTDFYARFDFIFKFFDCVEEITKEEFNEVLTNWINRCEREYLEEDDEFEPMPNWFFEENYNLRLEKYRTLLNNPRLEEKFNENNNTYIVKNGKNFDY